MLRVLIVVLLVGILISLVTGFVFFYKDKGRSKRVMYALGVRVTLAIILMICVFYGSSSGELTMQAPWN
jgi:glycopeptide antibiotics resistance protein